MDREGVLSGGRKSSGARMSGQEDLEKKTFEPIDLQ